jgi:hypothetical protein
MYPNGLFGYPEAPLSSAAGVLLSLCVGVASACSVGVGAVAVRKNMSCWPHFSFVWLFDGSIAVYIDLPLLKKKGEFHVFSCTLHILFDLLSFLATVIGTTDVLVVFSGKKKKE